MFANVKLLIYVYQRYFMSIREKYLNKYKIARKKKVKKAFYFHQRFFCS